MNAKAHLPPLTAALLIALAVAAALLGMAPPAPIPADAAPDRFSAERAFAHVREIARAPHPPGTPEHARARDYVRDAFATLGLQAEVQRTLAVRDEGDATVVVPVENIVARRPSSGDRPLILAAHYDSHPTGPGAGDDAAGVAALIETARALGDAPLRNPLLFLVTDAEEVGLVGAEGFVADSPDARRRDTVVLNFEARGGGGPVFMFETGDGNASLIGALGGSVVRPSASSLMYALYKLLPNDTDLSVFKREGFSGLNFAFVDRFQNYHTALDTPERLDRRSLQQHGDYALSLARRLGDASLAEASDRTQGDAIYFDVLGRVLIRYPQSLAWGWTALAVILYGAALVRARQDSRFAKSLSAGALLGLATLIAAGCLGLVVGLFAGAGQVGAPNRTPYGARWGEAGLYLLAVAAATALWLPAWTRLTLRPMALGALLWWLAALIAVTLQLPGGTYLFVWPLIAALIGLLPKTPRPWHALAALPTLLLWPVILHGLFLLMGYRLGAVFGALAAFALLPILPALGLARGWLPLAAAVAAIACLGFGLPARPADVDTPRVCTLLHVEDADRGEAWRATLDRVCPWSRDALGSDVRERPGSDFFPWSQATFRTAPTKPLGLKPPTVVRKGTRLHIAPLPGQRQVAVWTAGPVRAAQVEGKSIPISRGRLRLRFIAPPPTGFDLTLDADPGTAVTVDGYVDGLPADVPPRPDGWIPASVAPHTDIQLVRRRLRW